jgi:cytochrome c-type biogenesis protein CcmH
MTRKRRLLAVIIVVAVLAAVWSYVLLTTPPKPTLDQQVHDIASQLKCLVCQGESVADSPAELSQQMRALIRQQLQQGKSEQQIISYFQSRYGDRILYAPPRQGFMLLAWIVPFAILLCGAVLLFFVLRGWQRNAKASRPEENAEQPIDEGELAQFQAQLEQELAADDPLFLRMQKEVR